MHAWYWLHCLIMKLILGSINGEYLRNITLNAAADTEIVFAAVAYASSQSVLFDWCLENNIFLKFWGRYDHTVPISVPILEKFLSKNSANYQCRLVTKYHPKVIWWKGYGCYVGSANLSGAAWNHNVEAGTFYTEDELDDYGMIADLNEFFRVINENAFDLSPELLEKIKKRKQKLSDFDRDDKDDRAAFMKLTGVNNWSGLVTTAKKASNERQRNQFLSEWQSTLQCMRLIADIVDKTENRPIWLRPEVPASLVADQFLHAYYYNKTFDGRKANYEQYFEEHKNNPDEAISNAVSWWAKTPSPPSNENQTLDDDASFVNELLKRSRLKNVTLDEWKEICCRVHSIKDYGRRVKNTVIGLPHKDHYTLEEKSDALAAFHFAQSNVHGENILEVLWYVFYGGADIDLPSRIWETVADQRRRIDRLGLSAIGELTGWALPEKFPPRNRRTSKALRSLGFDVSIH